MGIAKPKAHQLVLVDLPHSVYQGLGYANSRDNYEHWWVVLLVDPHHDEFKAIPLTSNLAHLTSRKYQQVRRLDRKSVKPPSGKHSVLLGDEIAWLSTRQLAGEWLMGSLLPRGVAEVDALHSAMGGDGGPANSRMIDKLYEIEAAAKADEDEPSQ